ncbi:hypothetical protein C8J27_101631 [Rhodobacter aestuarii]|uniref:DUF3329 domain-containing protein n=1 Tax=Rhodobacter aestuarii TaxID=453582 RepID=A0A1N7IUK0_9RHOB|nr:MULTISPECIES: hypothetical protein [Rhodobacter]PTV97515.1 hypothetical protein C8J27_101631 [Rhodobacter aestuarii]SIS40744.1 hypothetical protein SAMN05421580_10111 [Rhodobacter aestuarii]SOC05390.1 hypothetical protein SAMN05877809_103432 [Rhodobacter sp. JA431]
MSSFDHPMFKPLVVRIAVVGFCFAWAAFEVVSTKSYMWAAIFAAAGAYAGWHLLIKYTPPAPKDAPKSDS